MAVPAADDMGSLLPVDSSSRRPLTSSYELQMGAAVCAISFARDGASRPARCARTLPCMARLQTQQGPGHTPRVRAVTSRGQAAAAWTRPRTGRLRCRQLGADSRHEMLAQQRRQHISSSSASSSLSDHRCLSSSEEQQHYRPQNEQHHRLPTRCSSPAALLRHREE